MTVIRQYDGVGPVDDPDSWDVILIGEPGADGEDGAPSSVPGPTGPTGPIGAGLAIRGALFGTDTPMPTTPATGDLWIVSVPIPTAVPDRTDDSPKANGDGVAWSGTEWINTGPIVGPRGFAGAGVPTGGSTGHMLVKTSGADYATGWTAHPTGISTDASGDLLGFRSATPVAKAASPGTAVGTDAAVINAVVTALRDLGLIT